MDFKNLKKGEVLSETQYYKVVKIAGNKVQLVNDNGENIVVDSGYVNNCLSSSVQFEDTQKITRTELAELFINSARTAVTVNFNCKVKEADVKKALHALYANKGGKILSEADYKKKVNAEVKKAISGEERTMIGRHYGSQDDFGRIKFIDMNAARDKSKSYDTRHRLVDPRTINWIIVGNVKYVAK